MKRITALLFIALLVVCNSTWANQRSKLENQAENMAEAISVPLYGYDLNSVNSVLASMVKDSRVIKAIRLVDSNSDSAIFEATKSDDGKLVKGTKGSQYVWIYRRIQCVCHGWRRRIGAYC